MPTPRTMLAIVAREKITGLYVAHCLEAGTYAAGKTPEEALAMLQAVTNRMLADDEEYTLTEYDALLIGSIEVEHAATPRTIRS